VNWISARGTRTVLNDQIFITPPAQRSFRIEYLNYTIVYDDAANKFPLASFTPYLDFFSSPTDSAAVTVISGALGTIKNFHFAANETVYPYIEVQPVSPPFSLNVGPAWLQVISPVIWSFSIGFEFLG